jgi:hypothetical protein
MRSYGCYTFTSTTEEGLTIWWCCSEDGSGVPRLCHGGRSGLAVLRYEVLSGGSKHDVLISRNKESLDFLKDDLQSTAVLGASTSTH